MSSPAGRWNWWLLEPDGGEGGGDGEMVPELALFSVGTGTAEVTTIADVTATIDADLFGTVDLVKLGLGTLVLNGDNTFANLVIEEGTVGVGANTSGGDGTITIANDATLAAAANGVVLPNDVITLGNGIVDAGPASWTFTLNGDVSGEGSISQVGAGNLVLNGDNSFVNLGINQGTVTLGSNTAGGSANIAINNNATLAAGKTGLVVDNAIQTTANGFINSGTGVFTLTGAITDVGSITKTGTGTLILTGTSSFTGTTTVAAGTLRVNGSTLNSAAVTSTAAPPRRHRCGRLAAGAQRRHRRAGQFDRHAGGQRALQPGGRRHLCRRTGHQRHR